VQVRPRKSSSTKVRSPRSRVPAPLVDPAGRPGKQLHELQNTLASLKLRLAVLMADPTCRWAQADNLAALERLSAEALDQSHALRALLDGKAARRRAIGR
jgi:hypothetical protein